MTKPHRPTWAACTIWTAVAAAPLEAQAFEPRIAFGASAAATGWRGDAVGYGTAAVGARFADFAGTYARAESGYGVVDTRLLGLLSIGTQLWGRIGSLRPYLRAGLLHQHEEAVSVAAKGGWRSALGVGEGIRHRAGGELGVGVDVPLEVSKSMAVFASVDLYAKAFPDELGPRTYVGAGLGVGATFDLGGGT